MSIQSRFLFVIVAAAALAALLSFTPYNLPRGWDVFYHARSADLTKASGFLLPFDQASAGGRTHSYPPFYSAILTGASLLTGLQTPIAGQWLSILFYLFTIVGVFLLSSSRFGKTAAIPATVLFATSFEVFENFTYAGMPANLAVFFLVLSLYAKDNLVYLFSFATGALNLLASVVLILFCLAEKRVRNILPVFVIPIIWKLLYPTYAWPTWGGTFTALDSITRAGIVQVVALAGSLTLFSIPALVSVILLVLSQFTLTLGSRWLFFALLPAALAVGYAVHKQKRFSEREVLLASAFVSIFLLVNLVNFPVYSKPQVTFDDIEGMRWLAQNTATTSTVLGYKDLSTIWVLYYAQRPTILDGYSEGLSDAYERQRDVYFIYNNPVLDRKLLERYSVRFLYMNSLESEWFGFDMRKFLGLQTLFDNNYGTIRSLA